jgi:hypothetical protein
VTVLAAPRADAVPPAPALAAARATLPDRLRELAGWVAVPSVSADPERADDVRRSGEVLAGLLRRAGAAVGTLAVPGAPPLVVGRVPGRGAAPPVLVYGHHDVVAPGPGWTGDPFRPVLRAGRLTGRGTTDDKGQLMAVVAALTAWRIAGGPPGPVWVVCEGAEEVGSPGLAAGLARLAARVRPGLVLVCDTEAAPDGVASLTISQRGHLAVSVGVSTGGPPVHPGRLGGAVADPSLVLAAGRGGGPARPPPRRRRWPEHAAPQGRSWVRRAPRVRPREVRSPPRSHRRSGRRSSRPVGPCPHPGRRSWTAWSASDSPTRCRCCSSRSSTAASS